MSLGFLRDLTDDTTAAENPTKLYLVSYEDSIQVMAIKFGIAFQNYVSCTQIMCSLAEWQPQGAISQAVVNLAAPLVENLPSVAAPSLLHRPEKCLCHESTLVSRLTTGPLPNTDRKQSSREEDLE
jgi:hypothetical protein